MSAGCVSNRRRWRFLAVGAAGVAAASLLSPQLVRAVGDDPRTHGRDAEPDYGRVFAQDRVGRLDIRITASDWQAVIADMQDMAGPAGGQAGPGGGFPGAQPAPGGNPGGQPAPGTGFPPEAIAACTGMVEGNACSFGTPATAGRCVQTANGGPLACVALGGGARPVPGGAAGGNINAGRDDVELLPRTPIYVPADVTFDGETFRHIGFRLKGNSSLVNTWRSGSEKLPFRLNADVMEAAYPDIRDQTFFGFPNLSFSNGALDSSYLRAKVVTDLFRQAGLPAPRTAFMRVYLDRGSGTIYLGLYTMIEVPDGPMLDDLFGSSDGNLYKPHSTGGRWTVFNPDHFPKKSNADDEDWTDIRDAIAVLNEPRGNAAAWRQRLEARFNVSGFLRWLALNTLVGNGDAYGGLSAHNYYLYGSPRHRDRLFWIPWDHDLSLSGGGAVGAAITIDLFQQGATASWPLIRFLLDDPIYRAAYRAHVEDLLATTFEPSRVIATVRAEQARIAPYVIGAEAEVAGRTFAGSAAQFDAAAATLMATVQARASAARRALGGVQ